MKQLTFLSILVLIVIGTISAQDNKVETLKTFLSGIMPIEDSQINSKKAIESINELAQTKAAKFQFVMKENIAEILEEAKKYESCFITVDTHTIIKIVDFEKCTQSGSWGVCMPFCEGYIQKGSLVKKEDYLNNIIGTNESTTKTIYLFNLKK